MSAWDLVEVFVIVLGVLTAMGVAVIVLIAALYAWEDRVAKRARAPRDLTGSDYPTRAGWFANNNEADDDTRDAS